MKTIVTVRNSYEGIHRYKDAPEEVSFLRALHRHTFFVKTSISVTEHDREIEFILLKRNIERYLESKCTEGIWLMDNLSCEMVARLIVLYLQSLYGIDREYQVTVSEDNENEATVCTTKGELML